ncbi:MAG: SDR family NAD(P)-dependent oxidoreductase [Sphingobacteriales bacterium JAD_PAG50586_3]|nr:MAG: SDR family NAD(P)-dependent oxidoreductase [Sphingobacteriales bacterium JAD_PAG50586_3]
MSSMVAFQGVPYAAHYAATKAYVQTFAEALAVELKPYGVDVLAAAPGPVKSGFSSRANMKMDLALTPEQVGVPILKALGRKTTVLPGFLTKLLVYSLRTVPRWGKIRIMKMVMGGMTQHQRGNINCQWSIDNGQFKRCHLQKVDGVNSKHIWLSVDGFITFYP